MTSAGSTPRRATSDTRDLRPALALVKNRAPAAERLRAFARYAGERACAVRSAKVALVVGTVLALINHYQALSSGKAGTVEILQILITYLVPYSVATFGSASQGLQMELRKGGS